MIKVKIVNNGKVSIRDIFGKDIIISLTPFNGIKPGYIFETLDNKAIKYLIIGHSDTSVFGMKDPSEWGFIGEHIWAIRKDIPDMIGCLNEIILVEIISSGSLKEGESVIVPETAEEIINDFQNS